MGSASGASASSIVSIGGSSSYSTSTSAAAASAVARLVATTAATLSPTKRTRSLNSVSSCMARSCPGWMRARQNVSIGRVLVREHLDDARERLGARGVDPLDVAVRDGAEDELGVEHARHAEVAAVDELPGHLLGHVVDGVVAPDVLQVLGQRCRSPLARPVCRQIRLPGGLSSGRLSSNQRRYTALRACAAGAAQHPPSLGALELGRQGAADAVRHVQRLVQRQHGLVAGEREVGEHVRRAGGRHDAAAARLAEAAGHRVARQAHEGLQSKRGRVLDSLGGTADHLRDRGRGHRAADAGFARTA